MDMLYPALSQLLRPEAAAPLAWGAVNCRLLPLAALELVYLFKAELSSRHAF